MIAHKVLGDTAFGSSRLLKQLINKGEISMAGNSGLKIFGTLKCTSGRRMKIKNRVFFKDVAEAVQNGYRPCGHCMRDAYLRWKNG